jgi:hypothetical protein
MGRECPTPTTGNLIDNTRQSHISLSKMVAVDDGYLQLCPLTRIRQEAAWRGRAREHPIRVVL